MLTDVEISRALNALGTTLNDQRPPELDPARCQEIVDGALAYERKLTVHPTGARTGELRSTAGARCVGTIELRDDGKWVVEQQVTAGASSWALPQPAHDRHGGDGDGG